MGSSNTTTAMFTRVIGNRVKWMVKVFTSTKLTAGTIKANGAKVRWFPEALFSTIKRPISWERSKITKNQAKAHNTYKTAIFTKVISKKANTAAMAFYIQIKGNFM